MMERESERGEEERERIDLKGSRGRVSTMHLIFAADRISMCVWRIHIYKPLASYTIRLLRFTYSN